jgi:hypothetical protein
MILYDIITFGPLNNQLTSQSIASRQITLISPSNPSNKYLIIIDLTRQTTYT